MRQRCEGAKTLNVVFREVQTQLSWGLHGWNCRSCQISHPHQIVSRSRKREDPSDRFQASMPGLTKHPNRLDPAEHFFDALPFSLTHLVSRMPRRTPIDRTPIWTLLVLRYMRCHVHSPHLLNEVVSIVPCPL